jgi:twitching motility protein PilJ
MDLKNIFKKKTTEKNTFSEFESMSNENGTGPFSSKEMEELKTVATIASEPTKTKKAASGFSKLLKKVKSEQEEIILIDTPTNSTTIDRKSISMDMLSEGGTSFKEKKIPVLSKFPIRKQYQIATFVALVGLAGLGLGLLQYYSREERQTDNSIVIGNLNNNLGKLEVQFSNAVIGKKDAFNQTQSIWSLIEKDQLLLNSIPSEYTSSLQEKSLDLTKKISDNIKIIHKNIDLLNDNSVFVQNTAATVNVIDGDIKDMNDYLDRLGSVYTQLGANQAEMSNIYFLKNSLQSINSTVTNVLLSDSITPETIIMLNKSMFDFKRTLDELYNGDETKGVNPLPAGIPMNSYKGLANTWLKFNEKLNSINKKGGDLVAVRNLSGTNSQLIQSVNKKLDDLIALIKENTYAGSIVGEIISVLFSLILAVSILLIFYIYNVEKDNRNLLEKINNNKNQASIFKLVREMTPLQDGDLTKKTTINDEIIGILADSINATIDSLASLVKKIKDTSFVMRQKTSEVNVISVEMLRANEEQAKAIEETGYSVINVTKAIEEISEKTKAGAQVAENSVKVSSQGAEQVLASINSMQKINSNMSETAHLMKKVTDSSKQISEIVELLADISENTSILALNATVQAAKAGEAGKGFKIVADSIQDLADKAGEATRRVGALIAAVQTDIQAAEEAVIKTTDEVSSGAELSEKASESLNQMTEVSNNLALIVRSISEDAKKNAQVSKEVANKMNQILHKTEENKQSTQKTAGSIAEIANISNELGESVQSFKI